MHALLFCDLLPVCLKLCWLSQLGFDCIWRGSWQGGVLMLDLMNVAPAIQILKLQIVSHPPSP
eukprot:12843851-Prorocentrum_lima.AAC.1